MNPATTNRLYIVPTFEDDRCFNEVAIYSPAGTCLAAFNLDAVPDGCTYRAQYVPTIEDVPIV